MENERIEYPEAEEGDLPEFLEVRPRGLSDDEFYEAHVLGRAIDSGFEDWDYVDLELSVYRSTMPEGVDPMVFQITTADGGRVTVLEGEGFEDFANVMEEEDTEDC